MDFAREPFERWHAEAATLFRAHWDLVGRHKELLPLNLDLERWIRYERAGQVTAFTARENGFLVGYAVYLTTPSLNYAGTVAAYCHMIYIDPEGLELLYHSMQFRQFIEFCDAELKRQGCVKSVMHIKRSHDFYPMIAPLGYEDAERLVERVL